MRYARHLRLCAEGHWPGATAIQHALDDRENERSENRQCPIALQAAALRVAPTAIVVLDPGGVVEWVNQAFEELTGFSNLDVLGFDAEKFCISSDYLPLESIRNDPAARKEYYCDGMESRKDGSLYIEERRICPVLDPDGALSHIVVIKKDVTAIEQKKKELELDIIFSNILQQSKSPEGICANTISLLKEQFPEAKPMLCLYTDGTVKIKKLFGEKLPEEEDSSGFRYEIKIGAESVALFRISCVSKSPLDLNKIFHQLANQLENALQRMIAQQKISAQIRNISFLKLISRRSTRHVFENRRRSLLKQILNSDCDAVASI